LSGPKGRANGEELPVRVHAEAATEDAEGAEGGDPAVAEAPAEEPAPAADEVDALRRERDELREALLRRRAEFENYRRRTERDRASAATEAEAAILRQVLGTVDNLERALAAGGEESSIREGVALTHRELTALLESLGVTPVDPLGTPFDPALHQAILHEPAAGFAAGTVAEVFRKGYTFGDRLLRPALVKVASGGGSEGPPGDGLQ
jgi:molecular chaperone GrpE